MKIEIEITASKEASSKYGTDEQIGKSRVVVEASSISPDTLTDLANVAAEDIAKQIDQYADAENEKAKAEKAKAKAAPPLPAPKPTEPDPFD